MNRRTVFRRIAAVCIAGWQTRFCNGFSFSPLNKASAAISQVVGINGAGASDASVAYRSMELDVDEFGVKVPVAMWFPIKKESSIDMILSAKPRVTTRVTYSHRISVKRIGELLAGWNFIPFFARKDFELEPTLPYGSVVSGDDMDIPSTGPVVLLAHGYLGSRFDLSHLAEELAQEGFICLSPEYPESLAASYARLEGLDRDVITAKLLGDLGCKWNINPSAFGIVGHSLGCGTVIKTGDSSWARVCLAGFTRKYDGTPVPGNVLFISSMNDGTVSFSRLGGKDAIPADVAQLDETKLSEMAKIPPRSTVVFDRPDAPNHISFLSEGVNDAMIDLLSPLLPVAEAMQIPVLDFDKYKVSRDSRETAAIVIPLVSSYLKQQML